MTPALPSSTRVPEVRSEGGSAPAPRPGLGLGLGKLPAARGHPAAHLNLNLNLNESQPLRGRAFSLVELLAVVGIIAMLSVAAVPVMRGLGGSQSSRAAGQILVSALEQTRTAAILAGTNAYLVILQDTNPYPRAYGIVRQPVDLDGNGQDDFVTNTSANSWVILSKWERLPGDLVFSTNRVNLLPAVSPQGLPPNTLPIRRGIGFSPSGSLIEEAGTIGLLFAASNRIANNTASQADRIEISFYSGRVRYAGLTNNVNPF